MRLALLQRKWWKPSSRTRKEFSLLCMLQGEYGLKDIYLGVPVTLGKKGIENIIELKLNKEEMELLTSSAKSVKEVMNVLDNMQATVK
jgi:malate dehydrogenase